MCSCSLIILLVPCELQEWECRVESVPSALTQEQPLVCLIMLSHCSNCSQMIQQRFWLISFVWEKTQRKRHKPEACFGAGMSWQQVKCFKHSHSEIQRSCTKRSLGINSHITYCRSRHVVSVLVCCPLLEAMSNIQERKQCVFSIIREAALSFQENGSILYQRKKLLVSWIVKKRKCLSASAFFSKARFKYMWERVDQSNESVCYR